jgi:hypothetical protein
VLIEAMRPRYLAPENVRLIAAKRDLVARYRATSKNSAVR